MYKFEIYRNPEISIDGGFVDEYRYDRSLYSFEREINPKWNDLGFKWSKEDDRAFYRKELVGGFSLVDDDYRWAAGIRSSATERNLYRIIVLKEKINNVWTETWAGFFSVIVGEWDLSNCFVTFSEVVVFDKYTRYLEKIEEEYNMMELGSTNISIHSVSYEWEKIIVKTPFSMYESSAPCDWDLPNLSFDEVFYDDKYTLYSRGVRLIEYVGVPWWVIYKEYRRDYVVQVNSPGASWQDLGEFPVGNGSTHKYVRHYLGFDDPVYTEVNAQIVVKENRVCSYIKRVLDISESPEITDYENNRARSFYDAVHYSFFGERTAISAYLVSSFFNNPTNPITGTANEYKNLKIVQFSDIRETSDPATKALYSFRDAEDWLRLMNVYWYIEPDTALGDYPRFEHKKYFDNGLTYGENDVGMDLSDRNLSQKLSYDTKNLPRIYELDMTYKSGDDFYGTPILYTGSMANWGDENKFSKSAGNMGTDIRGAILNQDAGNDGFFVLATDGYNVLTGQGAWSGEIIYNQPMSVADIEENLYSYKGVSAIGVMNGNYKEFDAVENNVIQDDVDVAWCEDFDPYKLVRTSYGDGNIKEAFRSLKDNKFTITIAYQE